MISLYIYIKEKPRDRLIKPWEFTAVQQSAQKARQVEILAVKRWSNLTKEVI
ncbi:hypothetical protein [Coxiella-like endosymbiont of Rhipicephalus sanguineus]|uniref:hypothetical protein n=1 Tax=Coxiella-like endosymbiont of Rhipicephalus sanguineus TaxID=1955402 RepID=UPI0020403AA6|nr:hypothetical protein [Coxiella-like endosymbiont of Rhipicephalus sanguineus]